MWSILWWLALIALGGCIIAFHNQIIDAFWDIQRAEENHIGTKAFYVFIAMGIIIIGVFVLFGLGPDEGLSTEGMKLWWQ
jgi:hypothetical protein